MNRRTLTYQEKYDSSLIALESEVKPALANLVENEKYDVFCIFEDFANIFI